MDKNFFYPIKERYLTALNKASACLLEKTDNIPFKDFVDIIGPVSNASRTYIFLNEINEKGEFIMSQVAEWCASGVTPQIDNPNLQNFSLDENFPEHKKIFLSGGYVKTKLSELLIEEERNLLDSQGVKSLLIIPFFIDKNFAGIIGFDNCLEEREWENFEIEYLKAAASNLANAIKHQLSHKELIAQNSRFMTAMDAMDAVVYVADMNSYELLFMNKYGRDIWGDRTGENCFKVIQKDQASPCDFCSNRFLTDEFGNPKTEPYIWEFQNTVNKRWYQCRDQAIKWLDGRLVRLEVATDITEKKLAEEALKNSEQFFRMLALSSPIGLIVVNDNFQIVYCNKKGSEILNYPIEEIVGSDFRKYLDKESIDITVERYKKRLAGEEAPNIYEIKIITKDGLKRNIEIVATSFKDTSEITKTLVQLIDVTEKKEIEAEKERLLYELNKQRNLESLGILAGGIAHDFNNLLTGVYGNISLAKLYLDSSDKPFQLINSAESSIERATSLTRQLLTFSKGGNPILENIDIATIIHETAKFNLSGSNVRLKVSFPGLLNEIKADKGQICQVISNIVINAMHSMPNGGEISISGENIDIEQDNIFGLFPGNYVKITISDIGSGISPEHIDKIFDPYFTTKSTGYGLGLSIVYSIIKKHNGYISVNSDLNKGTVFNIFLPSIIRKYNENVKDETLPYLSSEKKKLTKRKKRILIVDDEELLCEILKDIFIEFGYDVDICNDGKEAIVSYKKGLQSDNAYDLVILDLTIPGGMGGMKSIKEILSLNPNAKVIITSGYAMDSVMTDFRYYGFSGSITKPFNINDIKNLLKEVLD